ncbi:hypothetical protein [Xenorhabdus ishibashii]|uniref:Uncharacterized protein n=1 Tax=Xenorhabdus ishibashii TaxID=1034471 RepID=A0A2D0K9S3_9GAMM|nr:hypothetical protein [Xenorhabdus ishibashii]PHM60100.1 hypothetical protein Xish_03243 [Xenorhabdus ishibashii]
MFNSYFLLLHIIKTLTNKFRNRRKYKLNELSSWIVVMIGSLSFIIAGHCGLTISAVLPDFIKGINASKKIPVDALLIAFILTLLSIKFWFYGVIAKKCHEELYKRFDI